MQTVLGLSTTKPIENQSTKLKDIQDANYSSADHSPSIRKALARSWWHGYNGA
jgi:hypothetical protein